MTEPTWLTYARTLIGVREVPGSKSNPLIMGWAKALGRILGMTYTDDSIPWCGLFVAHVLAKFNLGAPAIPVRAKAWRDYGRRLLGPRLGCILIFEREGGGHVGFYVGEDGTHYHVLGGNQGDAVSIARIAKSRLSAMVWPDGVPLPAQKAVYLTAGGAKTTTNEA